MRAFLFVLPIEPIELGNVYTSLPPHCTLMPWFWVNATGKELLNKTSAVFKQCGPIALVSGEPALFGSKNDVPVYALAPNPALRNLHKSLWEILNAMGATHIAPAWVGDGYRPHVTIKPGYSFPPGSTKTIDRAYLIEALNANNPKEKRIIAEIPLF